MSRAFPIGRGQFAVLAAIVAVSGFGGGIVSGRLFAVNEAQAQGRLPTSIDVGAGGLVFRGPNGRVIAKLSSDASGGVFELFNANEQPGARLRANSFSGGFDVTPRAPIALPLPPSPEPAQKSMMAWDPGF
jgi:hypothetical protein